MEYKDNVFPSQRSGSTTWSTCTTWSTVITETVFRTKTNCEIIICNLFPLCWHLQLSLITLLTFCFLCDRLFTISAIFYTLIINILSLNSSYIFCVYILFFSLNIDVLNLSIPYTITVFLYSMIFDYIIRTFVLVYYVYRLSFVCDVYKNL